MHVLVSHAAGRPVAQVVVPRQESTTTSTEPAKEPNPILPVGTEIVYAFVGFMALFLIVRYLLFPKMKRGMDARYGHIRAQHEAAESTREHAERQRAEYEAGIAEARAEANKVLEVARAEVEADRQAKLAAANARIAERRAAATAETEAAIAAARSHVEDAVAEVASTVAGRALGRTVDPGSIRDVVSDVVHAGVAK